MWKKPPLAELMYLSTDSSLVCWQRLPIPQTKGVIPCCALAVYSVICCLNVLLRIKADWPLIKVSIEQLILSFLSYITLFYDIDYWMPTSPICILQRSLAQAIFVLPVHLLTSNLVRTQISATCSFIFNTAIEPSLAFTKAESRIKAAPHQTQRYSTRYGKV